ARVPDRARILGAETPLRPGRAVLEPLLRPHQSGLLAAEPYMPRQHALRAIPRSRRRFSAVALRHRSGLGRRARDRHAVRREGPAARRPALERHGLPAACPAATAARGVHADALHQRYLLRARPLLRAAWVRV